MKYEPWFETEENKGLLAISAWRMIRFFASCMVLVALACIGIGIGMWVKSPVISRCCIGVGVLLLPACCYAWVRPSASSFLLLAVMTVPFASGLVVFALVSDRRLPDWRILVGSVGGALGVLVFRFYNALKPLRELVKSVSLEQASHARAFRRSVFEREPHSEKNLVKAHDATGEFRIQLMDDRALFVERRGSKMFILPKDVIRSLASGSAEGDLRMKILHPLDTVALQFDLENAQRIKDWLAAEPEKDETAVAARRSESTPAMSATNSKT